MKLKCKGLQDLDEALLVFIYFCKTHSAEHVELKIKRSQYRVDIIIILKTMLQVFGGFIFSSVLSRVSKLKLSESIIAP